MQVSKTIAEYKGNGAYETFKNTVVGLSSLKESITKIIEQIFIEFGYDSDDISVHYVDSIILIFAYTDDAYLNKEILAALDDFMGVVGYVKGRIDGRLEIIYDTNAKSTHQTVFKI